MKKRYQNTKIVERIHQETGIPKRVINIVIYSYFRSLRRLMFKHTDLSITGFFKLKLKSSYRKTVNKYGNRVNFRKRKDRK